MGLSSSLSTDVEYTTMAGIFTQKCSLITLQRMFANEKALSGQDYPDLMHCMQAIRRATMGGAKGLKLDHKVGLLTPGKEADILLLDAEALNLALLDNCPQFLIGKAPRYDATFYNEESEFGTPKYVLEGDEDMSVFMHQNLMDQDFAFFNELKIVHSIICPIITVRPNNKLPVRRSSGCETVILTRSLPMSITKAWHKAATPPTASSTLS